MCKIRFVGLDVHADTIAVAIAEPDGEVRSLGIIPDCLESIRKLVAKLGPDEVRIHLTPRMRKSKLDESISRPVRCQALPAFVRAF